MNEQYFAKATFMEIGDGCVFTSLSTDMQRAVPRVPQAFRRLHRTHLRALFEYDSRSVPVAVRRGVLPKGALPLFGSGGHDVDGTDDE